MMRWNVKWCGFAGMQQCLIVLVLLLWSGPLLSRYHVDYAYAPARWMTPICLVDDWQKSLVDDKGQLVYDFGPGPYARAKTVLSVRLANVKADFWNIVNTLGKVAMCIDLHIDRFLITFNFYHFSFCSP